MKKKDATAGSPVCVDLNHPDSELYKHLSEVKDAVTGLHVTPATALVELYRFSEASVDNSLLRSLSGVARPKVPCQIISEDGQAYPPTECGGQTDCLLRLTFNKLLLAPTVRLEAHFIQGAETQRRNLLTLILEWHFNAHGRKTSGIRNYTSDIDRLGFTAGAATSAGFNNLTTIFSQLDGSGQAVATYLRSLLEPGQQHQLLFKLHTMHLTEKELVQLEKIYSRLPGGSGLLLPSIGQVEYAVFGEHETHVDCMSENYIRKPFHLLQGAAKHPMVALDCGDTFSTVKEAGIQLTYAASSEQAEQVEALKLWAKVVHTGHMHRRGQISALGVRFTGFRTLGGTKGSMSLRLPEDLLCKVTMRPLTGQDLDILQTSAILTSNTSLFPAADALFMLRGSVTKKDSEEVVSWATIPDATRYEVSFEPATNHVTYQRQLRTMADLQAPRSIRWHPILLNQTSHHLPVVDITSGSKVSEEEQAAAIQWLRTWKQWNQEQLAVINTLGETKGGMVVVMGPAGTGKTLLQQGLAIYFYKLGYRILALAPANSNANYMAQALFKHQEKIADLSISRLYPGSRAHTATEAVRQQRVKEKIKRTQTNVLTYSELLVALEEYEQYASLARPYGVVEQVLLATIDGNLKVNVHIPEGWGGVDGYDADAWELLRGLIAKYRNGQLSDDVDETYRLAYEACKLDWLERSRFVVTTTGNVRANELLASWKQKEGGAEHGVVVFIDEAAKDHEVNVWSGIVCSAWGSKVQGVFMFGDDKQLTPTNMSAQGDVQFNAFKTRLDVSLPCRLVREGFPCFRLLEQHRMHPSISAFPNASFYGGVLRDGPRTHGDLETMKPGLKDVLQQILIGNIDRSDDTSALSDDQVRLAWLEVQGQRRLNNAIRSVFVQEHIDHFFGQVFPQLRAFCYKTEQKLKDNLMIICAYKAALYTYKDQFQAMLQDSSITEDDIPRILTVDASQGEESFMVIFDGSCQNGDVVGFMIASGRCNVATTRAKAIFWIIGGTMQNLRTSNSNKIVSSLAAYKHELDQTNKTHTAR